jgi:hypothetical protein
MEKKESGMKNESSKWVGQPSKGGDTTKRMIPWTQTGQAIEPRIRAGSEMKGRAPYLADPSLSFPPERPPHRAQGFVTGTVPSGKIVSTSI